MATISGQECQAWRSERYFNINNLMLEMLAKGKRVPREDAKIVTEKESLIFKTTRKANVLAAQRKFEKEFSKYAGKKAPTAKIFDKCIGRTAKAENTVSL